LDVEIWLGIVSASASKSITINLNAAPAAAAVGDVCEYSGIATSSFLDQTASANGDNAKPLTGTTITTTQANELWVGLTMSTFSSAQSSPLNSFTLYDGTYTYPVSVAFLSYIASATGTANSGTTISNTQYWAGCIATFKAAASKARLYGDALSSYTC
jgi:hypothetical protein